MVIFQSSLLATLNLGKVPICFSILQGYSQAKQFIATQAPLPQTIPAFWRMIWEHHGITIVCLAKESESGKVRCQEYSFLVIDKLEHIKTHLFEDMLIHFQPMFHFITP